MGEAREPEKTPTSVVSSAADRAADDLTREQRKSGLSNVYSMTLAQLLAAIGNDARVATVAIEARPADVGELLQLGMATHQSTALVILAAVRFAIVRDGAEKPSIIRSIARISGVSSRSIKESVLALLRDTDRPAYQQLVASMDVKQIEDSQRDPAAGRLVANYVDRPADCAQQLISDADDDQLLRRHVAAVVAAMDSVSSTAPALLGELTKSSDPRALKVRLELVRALSRVVRHDVSLVTQGHISDDAPLMHAEIIVPVLAEAMLEPVMAKRLLAAESRGERGELELRELLHICLYQGWNTALRETVAHTAARTAATMFQESLEQPDEVDRRGESVRTAQLMATVAATQAKELDTKFAQQALALLKDVASFIPMKAGATVTAGVDIVMPKDPDPVWTRRAVDQIMRRVYERKKPMPATGAATVDHYENAYADWAATPLATYTSILSEKQ